MRNDTAFEMAASNIRYGMGVTEEVGMDFADMRVEHVMVLTDNNLTCLPPVQTALSSLKKHGVAYTLYDQVRVEPTDASFKHAIEVASNGEFDAFLAVGGGSVIDTAKAANLYATYPAPFLTYVNLPIGEGKPVPGPVKPLIAIPTTAGTGSETTGVAIFDMEDMHAKTGIAHRRLKPTLGIIDPLNTETLPPEVAIAAGLDVLSHAIESYTAIPYNQRLYPERPVLRPAYQGNNPISDIWALQSLKMVADYLIRAVENPTDAEARGNMLLAAAYAGIGFGNAGCHLPHGMSYPVSGYVKSYIHPGYNVDHPIIPHGVSVILNAPAVFRFTAEACPERHIKAAEMLGVNVNHVEKKDAGKCVADRIIYYMKRLDIPNGLHAVGYEEKNIPELVNGTLPQHRVTKLSPKPAGESELQTIFQDAMKYWE